MKLSEMKGRKAFKTVARLTPHISKILKNEKVKGLLKKVEVSGDINQKLEKGFEATLEKIPEFIDLIFEDSVDEIFAILGIMNDLTEEQLEEMTFLEINKLIIETIMDKDLIELFTSCIGSVPKSL